MRRLVLFLGAALAVTAPSTLFAQEETPEAPAATTTTKESNSDILVVPRKEVLKVRRVELAPFFGFTVNDPLIRHYVFGGRVNYFITDVLGIGLEYDEYIKQNTNLYNQTSPAFLVVPNANKYHRGASLHFQYIPAYGKFALFNRKIFTWEGTVGAGVGFINTEIIPRKPFDASFQNYNIAPNVSAGARFFFARWLALHFELKDHVFLDKFEPSRTDAMGMPITDINVLQKNAITGIVNNLVFTVGLSFWLPTDFEYRTLR